MASKKDIEAGKAFVTLYAKTSPLMKGLASVQDVFVKLGASIAAIGVAVTTLGATITASMSAAVVRFTAIGGELNDMAKRTGVATDHLAELQYAANQSATSIESVEKAIRKMQQALGGSSKELQDYLELLRSIGVHSSDIAGKPPGEQFKIIARAIASIQDPTKRAATAMDAFGKSGAELIPMFLELDQLIARAHRLGMIPDPEAVQRAAKLGNLLTDLKDIIGSLMFEIGDALAPMLIPIVESLVEAGKAAREWVKNNQGLVRILAVVGGALLVIGTIVTAIGAGLLLVGGTIALVSTIIGTIGPILAAIGVTTVGVIAGIVAHILLIGGAILLIGGYWLFFTESGRKAAGAIKETFAKLFKWLEKTMRGIANALSAGDWKRAWAIAALSMQLAFDKAIGAIRKHFVAMAIEALRHLEVLSRFDPTGDLRKDIFESLASLTSIDPDFQAKTTQSAIDALSGKASNDPSDPNYQPGGGIMAESMRAIGSFSGQELQMQNWSSPARNPQKEANGHLKALLGKLGMAVDAIERVEQAVVRSIPEYA